jgi:hypothetical protein
MKTLIAASILALSSIASWAQSSSWSLTEVPNANKEPVGYIYHVYSRGTAKVGSAEFKVPAGLRFVCSLKGSQEPIVAIFWNGVLMSGSSQDLEITVDKIALLKPRWVHEGTLIYSPVSVHPDLLSALKRGRSVRFTWEASDTKYAVVFDLKDFNLTEFNNSCKTRL